MNSPILIDGDFGVQLRSYLNVRQASEPLFDLEVLRFNRYPVYRTHMDYLRAGVQIIRTNTSRTTKNSIMTYLKVSHLRAVSIIGNAVRLAKNAVYDYYQETGGDATDVEDFNQRRALVAGCCGSYGSTMVYEDEPAEYWNFIPREMIAKWHRSRVNMLLKLGVDLLAFESIPSLTEAKAIVALLKNYPNARAWITFHCSMETKLVDGTDFVRAIVECYDSLPDQIVAVGADGPLPESIKPFLRNINDSRASKIPLMFYVDKYHADKLDMASQYNFIQEWWDIGVRYIGGASDTDVNDIRKIGEQLKNFLSAACIKSK